MASARGRMILSINYEIDETGALSILPIRRQ